MALPTVSIFRLRSTGCFSGPDAPIRTPLLSRPLRDVYGSDDTVREPLPVLAVYRIGSSSGRRGACVRTSAEGSAGNRGPGLVTGGVRFRTEFRAQPGPAGPFDLRLLADRQSSPPTRPPPPASVRHFELEYDRPGWAQYGRRGGCCTDSGPAPRTLHRGAVGMISLALSLFSGVSRALGPVTVPLSFRSRSPAITIISGRPDGRVREPVGEFRQCAAVGRNPVG